MTVKEQVIQVIQGLPKNVSLDDIQYRLHVISSVLRGKAEIAAGKGIPHSQVKKILSRRWNIK